MYSKGRGWRYIQANFCIPAIWSDDLLPTTHIAARSYSGQIRVHHGKYNDVKMLYLIRSPARTNIKVGSLRPTRTNFLLTLVTCRQQKVDPEPRCLRVSLFGWAQGIRTASSRCDKAAT